MSKPENSTANQEAQPGSLQPDCWAASFLAKLDEELLEVEGAMISARDNAEWTRFHTLAGQRIGLCQAKRFLKETQPNDQAEPRDP